MKAMSIHRGVVVFISCFTVYMFAYLCRVNMSYILPALKEDYPHETVRLGLAGSFFFWSYAAGQLINGFLGDKLNPKRMIFTGLALSAVLNLIFSYTMSVGAMLLIWTANGLFQSMLWGPLLKIVSTIITPKNRARVATGMILSTVVGHTVAWLMTGAAVSAAGWRAAMRLSAIAVMLCALAWVVTMRFLSNMNEVKKNGDVKSDALPVSLVQTIRRGRLVLPFIGTFCQGIVKDGIALWMPLLFMWRFQVSLTGTLAYLIMIPVFNFIGVMLSGWLYSRLGYKENRVTLIFFILTAITLSVICFVQGLQLLGVALLVGATSGMLNGINSVFLAVIPLRCAEYNRSSSVAGMMDCCNYLGAGISSMAIGVLVAGDLTWFVPVIWLCAAVGGTLVTVAMNYRERIQYHMKKKRGATSA